ncbi:LCP family glycopolymer transferase [Alteribacter natronophilus]|uniref:LCP family glycopolymer transferase n=1 Tax=Alteribacter natronophilus TaxID=2583810 RepID=UPI00110DB66A|nr:LCP family protein [Alteribacter natronophilus]TMW70384.1 LytR family transcriptional regulator [Alteribacter natronophilus]
MRKKIYIKIGVLIVLLAGVAGLAVNYLYQSTVVQTADSVYVESEREESERRDVPLDMEQEEPVSILLMGIGDRPDDPGRADSIMVLTVNPEEESMYMFNIPRDTRTQIVGRDFEDKINHAYAYGGTDMQMETVEEFLDIPIDYFASINMEGFMQLVDVFGGITVENDFEFRQDGIDYPEGEIHLDGEEALHYSRMRRSDPRGDLGRNERQREVLNELISEGASFSSITRVNNVLDVVSDNLRTNMTLEEMRHMFENYRGARHNIEQFEIEGENTTIDGVYYYEVSQDERERVSKKVKEHLGIDSGEAEEFVQDED